MFALGLAMTTSPRGQQWVALFLGFFALLVPDSGQSQAVEVLGANGGDRGFPPTERSIGSGGTTPQANSFLDTLAELCAARSTGSSECNAGVQFCQSHDECPSNHVCSCVRGCARLQCTLVQGGCPALPSPANGYSIQNGDFTHFGCNKGFTLTGPEKKECENGVWMPEDTFAQCQGDGIPEPHACDSLPCRHGGKCEASVLSPDGYICKCQVGYDGSQCQNVWLEKGQYLELLSEVLELKNRINDMGKRIIELETEESSRPLNGGEVPSTDFNDEVPSLTTFTENSADVTTVATTTITTTEQQRTAPTMLEETSPEPTTSTPPPAVVFVWPSNAVIIAKTTSKSISLLLPDVLAQASIFRPAVVLLQRNFNLQLQDWSPWTTVASTSGFNGDNFCQDVCMKYTVIDLQSLTRYQFAIAPAGVDVGTQSLADLDIVEAVTVARGAPIWSDYPFLEVESSPVSAVLDLPTLDKSVISRLSYYTVLSRQRRGSGTWSRWSKKDGLVRPSQERMEIDGLLASANVQIIVTAHLQDPFTGAVAMANSSILSISLPEAMYNFPSTPIAPQEIQRNSLVLRLPKVDARHEITELAVFLRHRMSQSNLFSPWRSILRLPTSISKYRIQNLEAGQVYQLRVRGRNTSTIARYSRALDFSTPTLDTPVWGVVSIADRTSNSITINIPKVDPSRESSVQYYLVSYHVVSHRATTSTGWQPGAGPLLPDVDRATVSGLSPDTRYDIRVSAAVLDHGTTQSAILPTWTLSQDAPVWLQSAFDDVLARSSSFVVNVPIAPPPSPVYAINMRRWLRTGLWAEWVSVLNMTMDQEAAQRVKTSSNDGGRKYIPVRIGPLQYETYYQVTVQYRRGSTQSPTSAVRTTRTLAGGTPAWYDRPVVSATPTSANLRMPRVLNGYRNITVNYTVEYRFAKGHLTGDISSEWRRLGVSLSPQQDILKMVGLPFGSTVEVRVRAHSLTSSSQPSPAFRIFLPLAEDTVATSTPVTLSPIGDSVLRSSCLHLCCSFAPSLLQATGRCTLRPNISPLPAGHVCLVRYPTSQCVQRLGECCQQLLD